jgi:hypothetical protein
VFGALIAEADGDFSLVASALDLDDNSFTEYRVHHIITWLQPYEMICIAWLCCRAHGSLGAATI